MQQRNFLTVKDLAEKEIIGLVYCLGFTLGLGAVVNESCLAKEVCSLHFNAAGRQGRPLEMCILQQASIALYSPVMRVNKAPL